MEHLHLANWDIVGIVAYLAILLGIGFYFKRFSEKGIENYFLAGRRLPGWINGISAAATAMNADVAPTYCGMTVISGLFIYWFFISRFGLALMVAAVLFGVFWWKLQLFTSPEFYEIRFAGKLATTIRSWIAFRSAFISIVAWTGAGLLGLHKVLLPTLGWSQFTTFSVIIPVVLIYVFLSGYIGVVFSDVLQTGIVLFSYLVLCIAVLVDFGGPAGLYQGLLNTFGGEVVRWYPPLKHEMLGLVGIIAWMIGTAIGYGGDAAPMGGAMEGQRIFSSRSPRDASKMYIWALVMLVILLTLLTMPALGAMVRWPGLHSGELNRETAFGLLITRYMPPGILWLAIAGMAASIMSTIDSNLNFGSQVVVSDIYRRFMKKDASERHYMLVGRIVIFLIIGLAILVAVKATNVIDIAIFMLGISSAELSANWAQWWWWRFNAKARVVASFGGPLLFIGIKYILLPAASPYWHVLLAIAVTTVLWIVISLVTRPDDEAVLLAFYRRARPLGFWGPIAQKAGILPIEKCPILQGFAVALLGMIAISGGAIAIAHLYVGRWLKAGIFGLVCIIFALLFKRYYRMFIQRLEFRLS
jgi:Na+/proline symporter